MDLEGIILGTVSQTERQILSDIIYMWNFKKNTFWSPRVIALLPRLSIEGTSSLQLPGHSGIQLQVDDVFLDPVLTGVGTDLPASFGLEAVERSRRVTHW